MSAPTAARRPTLLLMEDDVTLAAALARALTHRGFRVTVAHDGAEATSALERKHPDYAVLDLKVPGSSALAILPLLCGGGQTTRAVVLTGYASIATAVAAMKLGAVNYLPKPADVDEIVAALGGGNGGETEVAPPANPLSPYELEREHLLRVLGEHEGNISAAAKALGLHRRSLQRKLQKKAPPPRLTGGDGRGVS